MDRRMVPPQPPPNLPFSPRDLQFHRVAPDLWWLHDLFSLLIVLAVIAGIVYIIRMFLNRPTPRGGSAPRGAAIDALDLRYAHGEVDRAGYLQRRSDLLDRSLRADPPPHQPPPSSAAVE